MKRAKSLLYSIGIAVAIAGGGAASPAAAEGHPPVAAPLDEAMPVATPLDEGHTPVVTPWDAARQPRATGSVCRSRIQTAIALNEKALAADGQRPDADEAARYNRRTQAEISSAQTDCRGASRAREIKRELDAAQDSAKAAERHNKAGDEVPARHAERDVKAHLSEARGMA
ncbi:hypothetical protein M2271_006535 [Streptomyces sp. LBL]|uniref:hypothetical protein n=1 Tax=Streptomyces sp. LBL TaxID=2940562 RepID=UPI002475EB4E|nr:hypothetical protein [Streptomyces sp. LBL]MDH6628702.1 hypothetical protein [Streptomyces sp. LBL]